MVPGVGLEPTQRERRGILIPCVYRFHHPGSERKWRRVPSRTGLDGFAIRYITALLTRQFFRPFSQTSA